MDPPTCIPIVTVERNGTVEFQRNNLFSVLQKVGDRNFALIAVAGPKRTGKSYLCKNILYYLQAKQLHDDGLENGNWFERSRGMQDFAWRNGSERCTAGINIWSEPIFIVHNGEEIAVLLMDTEGSFDDRTNTDQSSRIFAWSSLLSSNFIYNIKNDIREDTLQFLESFLEYASLANPQDGRNNSMQKITFSVRDCEFSDYISGYYDENTTPPGQISNFYEKMLPNDTMCLESRQIRENLHSKVDEVGICLFPHPGRDLALHDSEENLDQVFSNVVVQFVELSVENLKLKHMCGHTISGLNFMRYVNEWEELFRGNRLPEMLTVAGATARLHNRMTVEECIEMYKNSMRLALQAYPNGMEDDLLLEAHQISEISAISYFVNRANGAEQDELSDVIGMEFAYFMEENSARIEMDRQRRQAEENNELLQGHVNQLEEQGEELQEQVAGLRVNVAQANRARNAAFVVAGVAALASPLVAVAARTPVVAEAAAAGAATAARTIGRDVVNAAARAAPTVAATILRHLNGNNGR